MEDVRCKKLILFGFLVFAIIFSAGGATMIIMKLNAHPINTDYLGAGSIVIMGIFLAFMRHLIIKRKILD